jgi:hypothetical protein
MNIDDICKYIGYIVVGLLVFALAVKSIHFQCKCIEGFVKQKPAPVEKETPI